MLYLMRESLVKVSCSVESEGVAANSLSCVSRSSVFSAFSPARQLRRDSSMLCSGHSEDTSSLGIANLPKIVFRSHSKMSPQLSLKKALKGEKLTRSLLEPRVF